jgi:histidinol-phosphate aminotransferase
MKDSIVVLDEAYLFFDVTFKTDPVGLVNRYPNLIILRTFSKYYALAGIRTGFAFLGDNHGRISLLGARYLGFNRLSEKIAIAALDSPEYYSSISLKMAADMNMLFNELNQWSGFTAYRSFANFIMVKIPSEIKDSLKEYLTERNMIIKFMNEEGLNRHIRITLGTHPQNCLLLEMIRTFMCKEINHALVQRV